LRRGGGQLPAGHAGQEVKWGGLGVQKPPSGGMVSGRSGLAADASTGTGRRISAAGGGTALCHKDVEALCPWPAGVNRAASAPPLAPGSRGCGGGRTLLGAGKT